MFAIWTGVHISVPPLSEDNTGEGEGELTEVARGTCWYHCGVDFFLTYIPVAKSDSNSTAPGTTPTLVNVTKDLADGFGSLKTVLGTIAAVYTGQKVRT